MHTKDRVRYAPIAKADPVILEWIELSEGWVLGYRMHNKPAARYVVLQFTTCYISMQGGGKHETMSTDANGFFEFLQQQIDERSIVEDDLDLARIAILVPDLCEALGGIQIQLASVAAVLAKARALIAEVSEGHAEAIAADA